MEENKAVLTDMKEAKELFEYEMTAVLLNVKGSFGEMNKEAGSEYLDMEVPKTEIDYKAPDIELSGIGYTASDEIKTEAFSAEPFRVQSPDITLGTADTTVHQFDAGSFRPAIDKGAFAAAAVSGTDSISFGTDFEKPDLSAAKTAAAEKAALGTGVSAQALISGAESAKTAVKPEVSIGAAETAVPEISAFGKLPEQKVTGKVGVTLPDSSVSAAYTLPAAEKPEVKAAVPKLGIGFEMPVFQKSGTTAPKFPEIPEKPDHSAYISEILDSIRQEL